LPAATDSPSIARDLESLIGDLTETHERMLALTIDHRRAISLADAQAIERCMRAQAEVAERIGELEVQRRRLVAPHGRGVTLTALAERLTEPDRARLVAGAARLRDVLVRLQEQTRTVRAATHSLVAHMSGLVQNLARALSQTRLYDPKGRINPGGPVACGLDLTH
jgi:hypothetical protein